jgi:hypothetical protein
MSTRFLFTVVVLALAIALLPGVLWTDISAGMPAAAYSSKPNDEQTPSPDGAIAIGDATEQLSSAEAANALYLPAAALMDENFEGS